MFGPSSPFFSPNLQPQGPGMGKLPLPKSSGIKGWQGDPGKLPTRAGDTRQRLRILLASQGFLAIGCDMGHFLKTQHPCRGNPQDTWGPECGGLTRESGRGCEAGPGKWGQSGRCVCEGRACSAGAGEACKWPGEPRVCTRGAGVWGTMRCAVHGVAGPGKGARRALCRACVCKRGAGVQTRGELGARGSPALGGALRASARRARTHPGSAEGPPLQLRLRFGLRLRLGLRLPAGLPQRARTGAKPGRSRRSQACSVSPRPPGRSAARSGGSAGPGRQSRAAPQSGHAPRSPPRAPSRSPARSLFKVTNPRVVSAPGSCAALPGSKPKIPKRSPDPRGSSEAEAKPSLPGPG